VGGWSPTARSLVNISRGRG